MESTSAGRIVRGNCLCGRVQFEAVLPSLWSAYCHCSMCRRSHGAPLVAWVGFPKARFRFLEGQGNVQTFASSEIAVRSHCRICASPLFFESERWPDEIHIALAQFSAPIDRTPTGHFFYDDRDSFFLVTDDLPCYGGLSGTEILDR